MKPIPAEDIPSIMGFVGLLGIFIMTFVASAFYHMGETHGRALGRLEEIGAKRDSV